MVFTGKVLLTLKTDILMSSHSLMPVRYVPESPRCKLSNSASHILLVVVSTELQVTIKIVFTSKFLLTLKTDISMPKHSLIPIRGVSESPGCQLSNGTCHILLASVPAKLQAAMELVFTSKFLLSLKIDILMPRHLLVPVRYVPESP
ncbi:hypothetical protein L873DRAFT_1922957 [Choiromyces venosus 120613-1]|uniref:Uncharacterized protein n=1 Tax=Choiromyces venosus 120613-1 TaxID=1336337 RepID=A0A3N4JF40_9PEZI|nr:hypothetical protein L873DRAFT_1922957 [Choiromyces venosus 120613-1]